MLNVISLNMENLIMDIAKDQQSVMIIGMNFDQGWDRTSEQSFGTLNSDTFINNFNRDLMEFF